MLVIHPPSAFNPFGDPFGLSGVDPSIRQYRNISEVVVLIVNFALGFVGIIAIIMVILGGFWYLTAAGNPEQAKKGAKFILYALIGIVVITLSYAIAFTLLSAPRYKWDESKIDYSDIDYADLWIGGDWSGTFPW